MLEDKEKNIRKLTYEDLGYQSIDGTKMLGYEDIKRIFKCSTTKACLIMRKLPTLNFGHRKIVLGDDLAKYLSKHGGVEVDWTVYNYKQQ